MKYSLENHDLEYRGFYIDQQYYLIVLYVNWNKLFSNRYWIRIGLFSCPQGDLMKEILYNFLMFQMASSLFEKSFILEQWNKNECIRY